MYDYVVLMTYVADVVGTVTMELWSMAMMWCLMAFSLSIVRRIWLFGTPACTGLLVHKMMCRKNALFLVCHSSAQTLRNGERGATFFYQSEMDSFARQDWDKTPNYGANGVSGYRVNALNHTGIGKLEVISSFLFVLWGAIGTIRLFWLIYSAFPVQKSL